MGRLLGPHSLINVKILGTNLLLSHNRWMMMPEGDRNGWRQHVDHMMITSPVPSLDVPDMEGRRICCALPDTSSLT